MANCNPKIYKCATTINGTKGYNEFKSDCPNSNVSAIEFNNIKCDDVNFLKDPSLFSDLVGAKISDFFKSMNPINLAGGIGSGAIKNTLEFFNDTSLGKFATTVGSLGVGSTLLKSDLGTLENNSSTQLFENLGSNLMSGNISNVLKELFLPITKSMTEQADLLGVLTSKTAILGNLSKGLREDMLQSSINAKLYGYELKDIGEYYTELSSKSGKLALINENQIEKIMPLAKSLNLTLKDLSDIENKMESIGINTKITDQYLENTFKNSIKIGLNANNVITKIKENINLLNEFNFKNGYDGLEKMVKKSVELRMEMKSITGFAEKIMDTDKAIETVANLQMIGGAIGDLNNPLKLMYLANNNIEELPNLIENAAKSLAKYDEVQGRFNITGINLKRARDMAQAFGMSLNELKTVGIAAAERVQASTSLMGSGLIFKNDEEKEFLINMSKMSKGQSIITVPVSLKKEFNDKTDVALESLSNKQKDLLIEYQKSVVDMDIKDIAMAQYTETRKLVNILSSEYQKISIPGTKIFQTLIDKELRPELNKFTQYIKNTNSSLSKLTSEQVADKYIEIKQKLGVKFKSVLDNDFDGQKLKEFFQELINELDGAIKKTDKKEVSSTKNVNVKINLSGDNQNLIAAFQREVDKDPTKIMNLMFNDTREMTTPA